MNEQDRLLIERLIAQLSEQSQAIHLLAQSNMAIVQAMAEADADADGVPMNYLDGSACL